MLNSLLEMFGVFLLKNCQRSKGLKFKGRQTHGVCLKCVMKQNPANQSPI